MMHLHEHSDAFSQVIIATSEEMGIPEEQVEKDYFVSYLLEHLVKEIPGLVFKGGTSLSKCYKIVKRFSEDIDIHYATNMRPTQSEKKIFKEGIVSAISNAGLVLVNEMDIKSRRDYNNYIVQFPKSFEMTSTIRRELLVESFVPIRAFPTERLPVSSYILEFLQSQKELDIIRQYSLSSFEINVQRIDRTFIDKIFAICDYYEHKKFNRNSRHLYDLHQIFSSLKYDIEAFHHLFEEVRIERQQKPELNISSRTGYDLSHTLQCILDKDVYEADYNEITQSLLFENVSYQEVKHSLKSMLEMIPSS